LTRYRYDEIVGKLMPFLKGVGYASKDVDVLPISGFTGANMKDILDPTVCDWWVGQPLLSLLDEIPLERKYNGPFLMPVADKTKVDREKSIKVIFLGHGNDCHG
jgi:peptide chain release factor subunit 3